MSQSGFNSSRRSRSSKENVDPEDGEISRDKWSNQLQFLCSCISLSVGLGNVWRFPFVVFENGGGVFLIPYFIVLLLLGRPMYYMEMCLGQFSSLGPVNMWEMSPMFKGVGYASLMASICAASFYGSVMAITVYFAFASFASRLPWSENVCMSPANDEISQLCQDPKMENKSFSEIYYFTSVFPQLNSIDDGIGWPHWKLTLCLVITWITIYLFTVKGVKSAGKISYFTAIFPYVVLIVLLIQGAILPGAWDGIYYFIKPDWGKLKDAKVWFAAVNQCFFSLTVGFGTIIYLSSHNPFRHNVYRDAIVISLTDTLTSLLAGCSIFALLGYLAKKMKVGIHDVTRGGPGLAFIAFPETIAHLEFVPQVFSILFFLMLFSLGAGGAMGLAGQVITVIRDKYPKFKVWNVALVVCIFGFISGIGYITPGGMHVLGLVSHHGVDLVVYTTAMLEVIAVAWVYGVNRFCDDIKFMLGRETEIYWKACWAFTMPVGLIGLLIAVFASGKASLEGAETYPTSFLVCGWLLTCAILSFLPICAIKAVVKSPGDTWFEKLKAAVKPLPSWGPKCHLERAALLHMKGTQESNDSIQMAGIGEENCFDDAQRDATRDYRRTTILNLDLNQSDKRF